VGDGAAQGVYALCVQRKRLVAQRVAKGRAKMTDQKTNRVLGASRLSVKLGDYVLATKYRDGDPQDHWAVGFYDREQDGRHYVVDGNGQQMRGNGFRRVAKISGERGAWLLHNARDIEQSGRSVWGWKRAPMSPNVELTGSL